MDYSCSASEYSETILRTTCGLPAEYLIEYLQSIRTTTMVTCMSTSPHGATDATDAEIGNLITNALIVKGVNQKALSDVTGIAYATLRRSLKGGRSLTIREVGSIAAALSVRPSALLPDTLTGEAA